MKQVINHPVHGEIIYKESFWTGKKTITVGGVEARRVSKKDYKLDDKMIFLKGSFLTGSSIYMDGEMIQLCPKAKWYEIVLAIIPFLFLLIWGNSVVLCSILPVIGGGIGGALGAIAGFVSMLLMKGVKQPVGKIIIGLVVTAFTIFIGFLLAVAFVLLFI